MLGFPPPALRVFGIVVAATVLLPMLSPATAAAAGVTGTTGLTRGTAEAAARLQWKQRIDSLVRGRQVEVAVGADRSFIYRYREWVRQAPASNEKLLLSMALLRKFPETRTISTIAKAAKGIRSGAIDGPLWLVGRGDPEINRPDLDRLAQSLVDAGLRRIRGRVMGATIPFDRGWWAPGWKKYFPADYVARPTALTYGHNLGRTGRHIPFPERRAAAVLTRQLRSHGVKVEGKPGIGAPKRRLVNLAHVSSAPLFLIVRRMNVSSINFSAEVLGKFLAAQTGRVPSIAGGAREIRAFAALHDVDVIADDSSGLSYENRVSPSGIVRLLWAAAAHPWGSTLLRTLATGGQGTLTGRFSGVRLRAKTGTLRHVSALSGWVWLEKSNEWAEFSILSHAMSKTESVNLERGIVRIVSANAEAPGP
jgi:serine-type D-Ala-D-Ala carboxypeptidase/endopeptidase (penicillin-binding protein 4)